MTEMLPQREYDVIVIGAGVAGLNCALHLPAGLSALVVCKGGLRESDSFLAQGGICVLRDGNDFEGYFRDTMRAGHYENDAATVRCMIEHSRETIDELIGFGARFERDGAGALAYTREGAHSRPRILFHADCTGREITSRLLKDALQRPNLTFLPHTAAIDLITDGNRCLGAVLEHRKEGMLMLVKAGNTVLATGGVGGLYRHSTNYRILTGDGLAMCLRHGVAVDHASYVQFHPTTLYTTGRGRRFLISESVRGEGATLLDRDGKRFVDELLPRDVVTNAIREKMKEEGSEYVRLDFSGVRGGQATLSRHFPSIVKRCKREGFDVTKEPVPVVPAQHYFMGGIRSDLFGRTTMKNLYAVGETCCNGVHGKNRLASNSLLEALIFAKRAAMDIAQKKEARREGLPKIDLREYASCVKRRQADKKLVWEEICREK